MADLSWWLETKRWLVELTSLERDALHIYFAMTLYAATAWVTRWGFGDWRSLLPLAGLELVNEYVDLRYEVWPAADRGLQWFASAHDVLNTLALPLAVMTIARRYARAD